MVKYRSALLLATIAAAVPTSSNAQSDAFGLGQIELVTVTAKSIPQAMGTSTLSSNEIWTNNSPTLAQAVNVLPGVTSSNSGGPRNEQLIFVHGFNRYQVPLSIDGIRIYLPADNRLDFARFLTTDLAQVQVAKGYVSVLNGPGAMGGEINLVTRKPNQALDVNAEAGLSFGNSGSLDRADSALTIGSRQRRYYLEASVAWSHVTRFELSNSFLATPTQAKGFRDNSQSRDFGLDLKAGYTPNATDEYSINYILQTSSKQAPFAVSDPIIRQRDWNWPYWDISSVYLLSRTRLGNSSYLKTRAYYNTFTNGLFSFDNSTFTTQTLPKSFRSYYDDYGYGGNIELGSELWGDDSLKGAFFYRRDSHSQWETVYSPMLFTEPKQTTIEDTYSAAGENTFRATKRLTVITGLSYDWRNTLQAQDYIAPTRTTSGIFVHYPVSNSGALNVQGALIYLLNDKAEIYVNASDRTRFPTTFERYSTRFDTAASNPGLKLERAINYEFGGSEHLDQVSIRGDLYYSDIQNAIESVYLPPPAPIGLIQNQNVGHGRYYGFELDAQTKLSASVRAGGSYTYTDVKIDAPPSVGAFQITGVPPSQAYFWFSYRPIPSLTFTPNVLIASNRWTVTTSGSQYYKTGGFTLIGASVDWQLTSRIDALVGMKNLLDYNYELSSGFPESGRSFFLELRYRS